MRTAALPALLLASLTACSTIFEGESQTINVTTSPASNANCILKNERGTAQTNTPGSTTVMRSSSPLKVRCQSAQGAGEIENTADAELMTFGNILIGGIIGLTIDGITGAMFSYDDALVVPIQSAAMQRSAPVAVPTYAPQSYAPQTTYTAPQTYSAPANTTPGILPLPPTRY